VFAEIRILLAGMPEFAIIPAVPGLVDFVENCWYFELLFRKGSGHDACLNFPVYISGKRICPV